MAWYLGEISTLCKAKQCLELLQLHIGLHNICVTPVDLKSRLSCMDCC